MRRVADGVIEIVQETADINPGARTDRPRVIEKKIEISRRGAGGQFETQTIVEAPNSSGAMQPFCISNARGFKSGKE